MRNDDQGLRSRIQRRRFLAASAAAGMGVLAGPSVLDAAGSPGGPWKMRLSCSSINFSSLPIEDACQRIAALGFEAVDIWSAHAGCPHLDDVLARLGTEGLRTVLNKTGLKLCAFSVYRGGYPKYAELLGRAGGGLAIRGSDKACQPSELVTRMKGFLESLKPELELAEKYHSTLAIENHGNALLGSLDSIKALVDANTNPRLGIALAPYHLQAGKQSVEEAIAACGKQLFFFYAWQNAPGVDQLPGHGPTDFTPWLAALARIGYRGYVDPFMHHEPAPDAMSQALAASRQYLEKCYVVVR